MNSKWMRWKVVVFEKMRGQLQRLPWLKRRNFVPRSPHRHQRQSFIFLPPSSHLIYSHKSQIVSNDLTQVFMYTYNVRTWCLSVYQGVHSSFMRNPNFFKAYLVDVTGTLPSVSPLHNYVVAIPIYNLNCINSFGIHEYYFLI